MIFDRLFFTISLDRQCASECTSKVQKTPYHYEFTKSARFDDFLQSFLYVSPGQLHENILRGMVWEYSPWGGLGILYVEVLRNGTKRST